MFIACSNIEWILKNNSMDECATFRLKNFSEVLCINGKAFVNNHSFAVCLNNEWAFHDTFYEAIIYTQVAKQFDIFQVLF